MNQQPLKRLSKHLTGGLVLALLLGIADTTVELPEGQSYGSSWHFALTQPLVFLHIIIGIILLIGAVMLAMRAVRRKDRWGIIVSLVGLVFVALAFIAGERFVAAPGDMWSTLMGLGFLGAIITYGLCGFLPSRARASDAA